MLKYKESANTHFVAEATTMVDKPGGGKVKGSLTTTFDLKVEEPITHEVILRLQDFICNTQNFEKCLILSWQRFEEADNSHSINVDSLRKY